MTKLNENLEIRNTGKKLKDIPFTDVYSTSEVKTNKVWTDGKPIYKKTLIGTYNNEAVLLSNVSTLVNSYGECDPGTGLARQLPYYELWNNMEFCCRIHKNTANQVILYSKSSGSAHNATLKVTLEYTKTS